MKIKTSFLSAICSLILALGFCPSDSLKSITKPYLGEYECTQAMLGNQDLLKEYDYITLELKADETYVLRYGKDGEDPHEETGKYTYDEKRQELNVDFGTKGVFKRKFPLKKGELVVSFRVGIKQLLVKFEQK